MKPLEENELYENLSGFLKTKGVELKTGGYAEGIRKCCGFLSDAINLGQEGYERAKTGADKKLEQARQIIHEKTAPKGARPSPPPPVQSEPQPSKTAPANGTSGQTPRPRPTAKAKTKTKAKKKSSKNP